MNVCQKLILTVIAKAKSVSDTSSLIHASDRLIPMKHIILIFMLFLFLVSCRYSQQTDVNKESRAEQIFSNILKYYTAGETCLFNENYPKKEQEQVNYLADQNHSQIVKCAYLWPTSGVFSGLNALIASGTGEQYLKYMDELILPGLEKYYDCSRLPYGYQSYLTEAGPSDRFYDDNIWLAIDFLKLYKLTGEKKYLNKSQEIWTFVLSGWTDEQEGGIFWCEQKKKSKNTCANAPAAVLALQLFEATHDSIYYIWGHRIYSWTQEKLQDPADGLYYDNISLDGNVEKNKYTYNSGQMLQAAALLYKLSGKTEYLAEAQRIAQSCIDYFTREYHTNQDLAIRLFPKSGNWFNAVLFRGYVELYEQDKDNRYILIFRDNLSYVWENARDKNGLFYGDWSGKNRNEHKWLLDQAAMVELYAVTDRLVSEMKTK